jgi:hypothetical protein
MMQFFADWGDKLLWALLAAVLLGLGTLLWRKWSHSRPGISGTWKATFTSRDGTENKERITISSLLWIVWGNSVCRWNEKRVDKGVEKEVEKVVTYRIRGHRKERSIVATYIATDQDSVDMGVFIVRLRGNGKTGNGIITSYDSPPDEEFDFQHLDACTDYHWEKVLPQVDGIGA